MTAVPSVTLPARQRPRRATGRGGAPQSRTPEFEAALGARIRVARVTARVSQTDLGAALGITYQQVQKYESGKDRVAVSTLRGIARALDVDLTSLLDDEAPAPTGVTSEVRRAMKVAADWQRIEDPEERKRIASLIAAAAREAEVEPESGS